MVGVTKILYEVNGWRDEFRINIVGNMKSKNGETILMFDPSCAEPIIRIKDEDGMVKTINLFSKYLIDHFGEEYYQYRYSSRFSLMDAFKRWNLGANLEDIEADPIWMKEAKELVNGFLNNMNGGNIDA